MTPFSATQGQKTVLEDKTLVLKDKTLVLKDKTRRGRFTTGVEATSCFADNYILSHTIRLEDSRSEGDAHEMLMVINFAEHLAAS